MLILPRFAGWWGQGTPFKMEPKFDAVEGADGWQISNLPVLSLSTIFSRISRYDLTE
jgi:kynureninase